MDVTVPAVTRPGPRPALVRSAMGGFFLLGVLMALLGAFLPVWVHYVPFDYGTAGNYFLAFNLGVFAAALVSRRILGRLGMRRLLVIACLLTAVNLLLFSLIFSPIAVLFPTIGLGFAAGMLSTGISWLMFDAMTAPVASTILSLAGVFFGCGAVSVSVLIWVTVHNLRAPTILAVLALLPTTLALLYLRKRSLTEPALQAMPPRLPVGATRSPTAVLLSLTLFFQSGGEWTVGGWLAIYWIRRLGVSLEAALFGLSLYWTALTMGKVLGPRLHGVVSPLRLATASTGASVFGCLLLLSTAGAGGAAVGVFCLGAGLGTAYPLTIAMIGERFPYYHPGFFNGLLSLSLIGGMLGPWLTGHLANTWVIEWAIGVPALAVLMVYLLISIIVLEMRVAKMANTA